MATGKFVAYYRVSTKRQGQSGLGLEAQQDAVRRYLNGGDWQLIAEFTETESGTRKGNDRPQLAAAIALARREKATLVIAKLDRLSRNVHFITGLLESGIEFRAVDFPEANKLTIQIMAVIAEHEAEMISRRTKEALAAAKTRGVKLGTPQNLTEAAQAKSVTVNKQNAVVAYAHLERVITDLSRKGHSLRQIAAYLNDELGQRTRSGACFTAMTVKRIMQRSATDAS